MAIFEVKNLCKNFGGLTAVNQLNLKVDEGEIRGVIGPNGAGKTTLFNIICGVYKPTTGKILYQGKEISGLKSNQIAKKGVVRTFQRTALFHQFTVLDNVLVASHLQYKGGLFSTIFGTNQSLDMEQEKKAMEIIEFLGLSDLKDELAGNLPHGHQRALGIAVALASKPKLIMLDEPVTGMDPTETHHITDLIKKIRDEWGMTILLVEHDMKVVMSICDKITVLSFGEKLAEGSPNQILENSEVIEAYLGGEDVVALLGGEEVVA